ncbi:hypothetical protein FJY90_03925 [Candidatus Gottesmanbacteria bacterium]|nr:hypothetical protein [Candidatus Gottesmanbacteria bacterium]
MLTRTPVISSVLPSFEAVKIWDTDESNRLTLDWDENDTADRTLNFRVNGGNRTLTIEADSLLNQDLTSDASPTFGGLTVPTIYGSADLVGNLTLQSTSHAIKGNILMQTAGGNVGIGTTSPERTLDVQAAIGTMRIKSTTGTNKAFALMENTAGTLALGLESSTGAGLYPGTSAYSGVIGHSGNQSLHFGTNNTVQMTISGSGNVGIGTTGPGAKLDVGGVSSALASTLSQSNGLGVSINNASYTVSLGLENKVASSSFGGTGIVAYSNDGAAMANGDRLGYMLFGGSSSASSLRNTAGFVAYASQDWVDASAYGTDFAIEVTANNATSRSKALYIQNSGNVGIGTTNFGTNAVKVLALGTGTAPTTSPADIIQLYSADYAAGDARLYIRNEAGVLTLPQSGILTSPDGWTYDTATWTYASATTFTVSGDVTATFQKGTKIKLTQTTAKYFYVTSSSYSAPNTTVTVTGGADYSIANATITSPAYSSVDNPQGFPDWFNHTVVYGGFSADPTATSCKFRISGKTVFFYYFRNAAGTSNAATFTMSLPVAAENIVKGACDAYDNGAFKAAGAWRTTAGSTTLTLYTSDAEATWTASGTKLADVYPVIYEMD